MSKNHLVDAAVISVQVARDLKVGHTMTTILTDEERQKILSSIFPALLRGRGYDSKTVDEALAMLRGTSAELTMSPEVRKAKMEMIKKTAI